MNRTKNAHFYHVYWLPFFPYLTNCLSHNSKINLSNVDFIDGEENEEEFEIDLISYGKAKALYAFERKWTNDLMKCISLFSKTAFLTRAFLPLQTHSWKWRSYKDGRQRNVWRGRARPGRRLDPSAASESGGGFRADQLPGDPSERLIDWSTTATTTT